MKLFNLRKKSKSVKGIIDVNMLLDKAAFEIKYENGDSIQYSIIDLVKQLDYLDNKMDEKVAANIFFGIMGAFFSLTLFSSILFATPAVTQICIFKSVCMKLV